LSGPQPALNAAVAAGTRVFALLGDPVEHSLSPLIQNAAFQAASVDGVYAALGCGVEELPGLIRGLSRAGGGGNITLPHKERAATLVDFPNAAVRRTGACNTFWLADGKVMGDNTDVEGFSRALTHFLGGPPEGCRVLLLGAGGAARAALVALLDDGVGEVRLLNRSVERARAVSRRIGGERVRVLAGPEEAWDSTFDLVVNATRLGLGRTDPLPFDLARLAGVGGVMDLVYGPRDTPFVEAAREAGIPATDGREMLVQQGAAAFERWWNVEAPVAEMRRRLEAAVG
jgi:shikimate dehydrogenase